MGQGVNREEEEGRRGVMGIRCVVFSLSCVVGRWDLRVRRAREGIGDGWIGGEG